MREAGIVAALTVAMGMFAGPAPAQDGLGNRENEIGECSLSGGIWVGAADHDHPKYIPAGRCIVIATLPLDLPEDEEAMCAVYGGFWADDVENGLSICVFRNQ